MKLRIFTCTLLVAFLCATAQAGLLDKVKDAAKDVTKSVTKGTETKEDSGSSGSSDSSNAGSSGSSSSGTAPKAVAAASSAGGAGKHPGPSQEKREYYPSLSFSTVLNGVKIHYERHKFFLDNVQGTFIPDNAEGYIILRKADGPELYRYDFKAQPLKQPFTLLELMGTVDVRTGKKLSGGGTHVDLDGPGDYVLDFYLPSEHFYSFPFSVKKVGSDDPFAGGDWLVTKGAWDDWGYLYIPQADPEQNLIWKMWLQRETKGSTSRLGQDVKVRVEISGPGGVVCVSRDATRTIQPGWVRWEYDMAYPSEGTTTWNEYFKAKHLLAKDGDYTLTVKIDDKAYGTWKFSVAGGKLQYKGQTVRAEADPLHFVEGGRDAWWYHKE